MPQLGLKTPNLPAERWRRLRECKVEHQAVGKVVLGTIEPLPVAPESVSQPTSQRARRAGIEVAKAQALEEK